MVVVTKHCIQQRFGTVWLNTNTNKHNFKRECKIIPRIPDIILIYGAAYVSWFIHSPPLPTHFTFIVHYFDKIQRHPHPITTVDICLSELLTCNDLARDIQP